MKRVPAILSQPVRVLFLVAIGSVCSFSFIGRQTLSYDEGISQNYALIDLASLRRAIHLSDAPQAAYYLALHIWAHFGHNTAVLRSLSALAVVLTIPFAYGIAREMFGTSVAMMTGLFVATSSFAVAYADDARPYGLALCFCTIATYAFLKSVTSPRWSNLIAYVGSATAAVYFHLFAAFLLLAHLLSLPLFPALDRTRTRRLFVAYIVVGFLCLPLFLLVHATGTKQVAWLARPHPSALWALLVTSADSHVLALLFVVLIPAACAYAAVQRSRSVLVVLLWVCVPVGTSYCLSLVAQPIFLPRYLIVVLVPFLLTVSLGITALRNPVAVTIVTSAVVALSLHAWWSSRHSPGEGGVFFSAAAFVEAHARAGDGVMVFPPQYVFAYRSAERKLKTPSEILATFPSATWQFRPGTGLKLNHIAPSMQQHERVWLVVPSRTRSTPAERRPVERTLRRFFRDFKPTRIVDFPSQFLELSVMEFRRVSARSAQGGALSEARPTWKWGHGVTSSGTLGATPLCRLCVRGGVSTQRQHERVPA